MKYLYNVDFANRKLLSTTTTPESYKWMCDCCGKIYTNIEGNDNMKRVDLVKEVGKNKTQVTFKLCASCATGIYEMFEGE